ncbi:hypothetical protein AX774_g969 [Zancudomyces culisetae]|uniref:Uncharacterized protein n=1 Tax=Zancudomyces culisetae TaxID=1213189 RepID=A0A1R1PX19_ZANCU|nr:hypothetical protein AX774_g969 [Zancudomyces culisetae]|eukprot:OMH85479.1 hypothetical protein AX774_g969 [Zancudomyces culisetae]
MVCGNKIKVFASMALWTSLVLPQGVQVDQAVVLEPNVNVNRQGVSASNDTHYVSNSSTTDQQPIQSSAKIKYIKSGQETGNSTSASVPPNTDTYQESTNNTSYTYPTNSGSYTIGNIHRVYINTGAASSVNATQMTNGTMYGTYEYTIAEQAEVAPENKTSTPTPPSNTTLEIVAQNPISEQVYSYPQYPADGQGNVIHLNSTNQGLLNNLFTNANGPMTVVVDKTKINESTDNNGRPIINTNYDIVLITYNPNGTIATASVPQSYNSTSSEEQESGIQVNNTNVQSVYPVANLEAASEQDIPTVNTLA